jgi:hypothetical protein
MESSANKVSVKIFESTRDRLLGFILTHGSKDEANWIRGNLKMFAEAIRRRGERPGTAAGIDADARRLVDEYHKASFEKRRRMLAFAAKEENLEPEVMPSRHPAARRKSGAS